MTYMLKENDNSYRKTLFWRWKGVLKQNHEGEISTLKLVVEILIYCLFLDLQLFKFD